MNVVWKGMAAIAMVSSVFLVGCSSDEGISEHLLIVENGSGSGMYVEGDVVALSAPAKDSADQCLISFSGDTSVTVTQNELGVFSLVMPNGDVKIGPVYGVCGALSQSSGEVLSSSSEGISSEDLNSSSSGDVLSSSSAGNSNSSSSGVMISSSSAVVPSSGASSSAAAANSLTFASSNGQMSAVLAANTLYTFDVSGITWTDPNKSTYTLQCLPEPWDQTGTATLTVDGFAALPAAPQFAPQGQVSSIPLANGVGTLEATVGYVCSLN
jgi:hypothetical protein